MYLLLRAADTRHSAATQSLGVGVQAEDAPTLLTVAITTRFSFVDAVDIFRSTHFNAVYLATVTAGIDRVLDWPYIFTTVYRNRVPRQRTGSLGKDESPRQHSGVCAGQHDICGRYIVRHRRARSAELLREVGSRNGDQGAADEHFICRLHPMQSVLLKKVSSKIVRL